MIKNEILEFLKSKSIAHGESVQYGWFTFYTIFENGIVDLETLDFEKMASCTTEFSIVEKIQTMQESALLSHGKSETFCNMLQYALVTKSYDHTKPHSFMSRISESDDRDSGWYIGIENDPLDIDDPENITFCSLYELSIKNKRFLPYWLFPVGTCIQYRGDEDIVSCS